MELTIQDKEALKVMPREEVSKILSEWVGESHPYTQNNRDWTPIEVIEKHFGDHDVELKTKIINRAKELNREKRNCY